jgi:hypothetical protein
MTGQPLLDYLSGIDAGVGKATAGSCQHAPRRSRMITQFTLGQPLPL